MKAGFSYYVSRRFCWGPPFRCSASTTLLNVDTSSSIILSGLCTLIVSLISSSRTLLLSWVISLGITVYYSQESSRISTSRKTNAKLADNELGSTVSCYSSTPFQFGKFVSSYSSITHECMGAYRASIFSGFVTSPPLTSNTTMSFLLLFFSSHMCPPSCLPIYFLTVDFLHLSAGLGFDLGGLQSSSVPLYNPFWLIPLCCFCL